MTDFSARIWTIAVLLWILALISCALLGFWVVHACFWSHAQLKRQNTKIIVLNWVAIIFFTLTTCILAALAINGLMNFIDASIPSTSSKFKWFGDSFSFKRIDVTIATFFYGLGKYALYFTLYLRLRILLKDTIFDYKPKFYKKIQIIFGISGFSFVIANSWTFAFYAPWFNAKIMVPIGLTFIFIYFVVDVGTPIYINWLFIQKLKEITTFINNRKSMRKSKRLGRILQHYDDNYDQNKHAQIGKYGKETTSTMTANTKTNIGRNTCVDTNMIDGNRGGRGDIDSNVNSNVSNKSDHMFIITKSTQQTSAAGRLQSTEVSISSGDQTDTNQQPMRVGIDINSDDDDDYGADSIQGDSDATITSNVNKHKQTNTDFAIRDVDQKEGNVNGSGHNAGHNINNIKHDDENKDDDANGLVSVLRRCTMIALVIAGSSLLNVFAFAIRAAIEIVMYGEINDRLAVYQWICIVFDCWVNILCLLLYFEFFSNIISRLVCNKPLCCD